MESCRRVILSPEPSFSVRLYEKVVPVAQAKPLPSRFKTLARGTPKHRPRPFFGQIYRPPRFQFICNFVLADCSVCTCSVCVNWSLVGEAKITKLFIWRKSWLALQGHPTFKASDPPPRATLPPEPTLQILI